MPIDFTWNRTAPWMRNFPVLVIDGRRSFVAAWPPGALCESCDQPPPPSGGYVGPVSGSQMVYPAPEARFVCQGCARSKLGLGERELTGHMCQNCSVTDDTHVDFSRYLPNELDSMTPEERVAYVSAKGEYPERGWQVIAVESASHLTAGTGVGWAVYFESARKLW